MKTFLIGMVLIFCFSVGAYCGWNGNNVVRKLNESKSTKLITKEKLLVAKVSKPEVSKPKDRAVEVEFDQFGDAEGNVLSVKFIP